VTQRQRGFDQARDAGRCVKMTDVRFHRTDGAKVRRTRTGAKGLGQCLDFDRIAQRRARAVGFDVIDGFGREAGHGPRSGDDLSLALHARGGVANLFEPSLLIAKPLMMA